MTQIFFACDCGKTHQSGGLSYASRCTCGVALLTFFFSGGKVDK